MKRILGMIYRFWNSLMMYLIASTRFSRNYVEEKVNELWSPLFFNLNYELSVVELKHQRYMSYKK